MARSCIVCNGLLTLFTRYDVSGVFMKSSLNLSKVSLYLGFYLKESLNLSVNDIVLILSFLCRKKERWQSTILLLLLGLPSPFSRFGLNLDGGLSVYILMS